MNKTIKPNTTVKVIPTAVYGLFKTRTRFKQTMTKTKKKISNDMFFFNLKKTLLKLYKLN